MLDFYNSSWYNSAIMKLPGTTTPEVHTYPTADRQVDPEQLYFDIEQINQPLTPEQQAVFDRAGEELTHRYQTELRSGLGKRIVEYRVLNDNDATESDCMYVNGWGLSMTDPPLAHAMKLVAATHPEKRILIPTSPGLEGTDSLPSSIARRLYKGSFVEVGDYILEAMRPARHLDNPFDVYGYSWGASAGIGAGAASEKGEIRDIRVIDPAALQRRTIVGMLIASQVSVAHAKKIQESTAAASDFAPPSRGAESESQGRRHMSLDEINNLLNMYVRYPIALGRAALWSDAERALEKISGDITAIIGEHSEYNKVSRVQTALSHSAFVGTGLFRIGTFNGFHSSIVANAGSLAALA